MSIEAGFSEKLKVNADFGSSGEKEFKSEILGKEKERNKSKLIGICPI